MTDQIGLVVSEEENGRVQVVTDRPGGCGHCQGGSKIATLAINGIGAQKGDTVKLSIDSGDLLKGAALLYLAPALAMMLGAVMGPLAGQPFGWTEAVSSVVGASGGLAIGFMIMRQLNRSGWTHRRLTPNVTAIVNEGERCANRSSQSSCCSGCG